MHWNNVILHPGNEELQRFIDIGILAATLEVPIHFHVEGVRGTGKTTLIRAARSRLPEIEKVTDCLYNCDPVLPHCPEHSGQPDLQAETAVMPFLEISHSAKVGTVVGSIDLDKLTSVESPAAAILPGTLPRANRGIVFVDEINRLADTSPALVDVLLDAMGTKPGRIQIEETGLHTVEMPLNVNVWAASNPDEEPGPLQEIRRQLADRFDFVVRIDRPELPETVTAIMNAQQHLQLTKANAISSVKNFSDIQLQSNVEEFLSNLYIRFRLESIRGIQAARLGALLQAALRGKRTADFSDLAAVLPAALRHRVDAPKLQEIGTALRDATTAGQRNVEKAKAANVKGMAKDRLPYRYPALWRGIIQRLTQKKSSGTGKDVAVDVPEPARAVSELSSEKKTIAVLTKPEERDEQRKHPQNR
jgi:magnesium chelatase subunit I